MGDLELKVVGADQDSVDPEVADGVARDLEVTAVVDLQTDGIAQASEPVRMAVGSLVGDFILIPTYSIF